MKQEIKLINLVNLLTLIILYESPMHGYALMSELERKLGKKPSRGQIYSFLNELVEKDYLELTATGSRGKKIYKITPKGKRLVEYMLERFETLLYIALEKKVNACANCGCKIYEGGVIRKVNGKKLLFCCSHCASNYSGLQS
jgi:DNA-binding PadR family transcriptional regulator